MKFGKVIFALAICLVVVGIAMAAETNVYWRVDLNQGTSIIAYGQGSTEEAAWQDCRRLRAITRAMTAAETRKSAVSAVTTSVVRWCKNPMQYATAAPDPVIPPTTGSATLNWTAPTQNDNGSALTNLAGYRILYGTSATTLDQTIQLPSAGANSYTVPNLSPGTYYFAVRSYRADGAESINSGTGSKVIR